MTHRTETGEMAEKVKTLKLAGITVDPSVQPRKGLNEAHVADLELSYRRKKAVKRPVVWQFGDAYKLSQGFHRVEAAGRAGLTEMEFEIRSGTEVDWQTDALTSNKNNALKLNNDEKRDTVNRLIVLHPEWTQDQIADEFGVTQQFVGEVIADRAAADAKAGEFTTNVKSPVRTSGKKGRGRPSKKVDNAARIGSALKTNHERADEAVAAEIGCKPGEVKKRRAALVKGGHIPLWPAPKPKLPKSKPPTEPEPQLKDGLGNPVPRELADTFGDPMLAAAIARIDAVHKELLSIEQHVLNTLLRKGEFWPYAQFGECAKSLGASADRAAEASAQLSNGLPFCVCPTCKGCGCKACRNSGAWSRHRHEQRAQYGDKA